MIDRNHPAVTRCFPDGKITAQHRIMAETFAEVIREALPHLTADDLRDTPAGKALLEDGWDEGKFDTDYWWEKGGPWRTEVTITNPYRKDTTHE